MMLPIAQRRTDELGRTYSMWWRAMQLFIFARFHARVGQECAVEEALREVSGPSLQEAGCRGFHVFRSTRDPRLFFIHSRWEDEAAFEIHADLPHTVRFIETVEPLLDHPLDVNRTAMIL
jgi:quinol monooxygenase YgiN